MDRIEKLERELRNTRRAGIAIVVCVLCGGFAVGWSANRPGTPDELVAKKLRIVDGDGRDAVVLRVEDGVSLVEVFGSDGEFAGLGVGKEVAGFTAMSGGETNPLAALAVTRNDGVECGLAIPDTGRAFGITQPNDSVAVITKK